MLFIPAVAETQLIDINNASLDELKKLPIKKKDAETLYWHIYYGGPLESVYELREIMPFSDPEKFNLIKPLVKISHEQTISENLARLKRIEYKIENWVFEEGVNENISDLWVDIASYLININEASMFDLMNIPGITPQSALRIIKYRRQRGGINSRQEFRSIPGITGYSYIGARDLIRYDDPKGSKDLNFHYQFRMSDSPYEEETQAIFTENFAESETVYDSWYHRLDLLDAHSKLFHKFNIGFDRYKAGFLASRPLGGEVKGNRLYNPFDYPLNKGFISAENLCYGPFCMDRLILGNYYVSLGQGVIMENTDAFKPRKYGFYNSKRFSGIMGDLSQTSEYQLNGFAFQSNLYRKIYLTSFYSIDNKDAVLNQDSTSTNCDNSFASYIDLGDMFSNDDLESAGLLPMNDVLEERTFGTDLRFHPIDEISCGFSFLQLNYDREYDPQISAFVDDETFEQRRALVDNEYLLLSSPGGKSRRMIGFHFQAVHGDLSFQGEYGELADIGKVFKLGDEPKGLVLSLLLHTNKLDFLTLYRNYDIIFDNPYSRSFSNYQRYKSTIFTKPYYMDNPVYGLIYNNSASPQAEEGVYFDLWYQLTSALRTGLEFDVWNRKADGSKYNRIVLKLSYQPIRGLNFNLRQKWQSRNEDNVITMNKFENLETRLTSRFRLSKFDEIVFLYSKNDTYFPSSPRFSFDVEPNGEKPLSGSVVSPGEALGFELTHNFNDDISSTIAGIFYKGFLWNFEEGEFVVLETENNDAFRYWISIKDNISKHMVVRAKYTWDYEFALNNPDIRTYNNEPEELDGELDRVQRASESFRLQIDYFWW